MDCSLHFLLARARNYDSRKQYYFHSLSPHRVFRAKINYRQSRYTRRSYKAHSSPQNTPYTSLYLHRILEALLYPCRTRSPFAGGEATRHLAVSPAYESFAITAVVFVTRISRYTPRANKCLWREIPFYVGENNKQKPIITRFLFHRQHTTLACTRVCGPDDSQR